MVENQELRLEGFITRFEAIPLSELRDIAKLTDFSTRASIQSFKANMSKEEQGSTGSLAGEKIFVYAARERKRELS